MRDAINLANESQRCERQLSPIGASFKNNVENAGALSDDDVFHVQATARSVHAKLSAHDKKNAKTHHCRCHKIKARSEIIAGKLDQSCGYERSKSTEVGTEML